MKKLCSFSAIVALASVIVSFWPASAQAREVILIGPDNGREVTLQRGDTLVVRMESNPSTGYSWYTVLAPDSIVNLSGHQYIPGRCGRGSVGCPGIEEFRFSTTTTTSTAQMGEWLRMLYLRPFDRGIEGANLWEVHVTIAP